MHLRDVYAEGELAPTATSKGFYKFDKKVTATSSDTERLAAVRVTSADGSTRAACRAVTTSGC